MLVPQSGVVVYPCNARNLDPDTEYKISLSYIARPFLKKKKTKLK